MLRSSRSRAWPWSPRAATKRWLLATSSSRCGPATRRRVGDVYFPDACGGLRSSTRAPHLFLLGPCGDGRAPLCDALLFVIDRVPIRHQLATLAFVWDAPAERRGRGRREVRCAQLAACVDGLDSRSMIKWNGRRRALATNSSTTLIKASSFGRPYRRASCSLVSCSLLNTMRCASMATLTQMSGPWACRRWSHISRNAELFLRFTKSRVCSVARGCRTGFAVLAIDAARRDIHAL